MQLIIAVTFLANYAKNSVDDLKEAEDEISR
jgi:hypothetical protein